MILALALAAPLGFSPASAEAQREAEERLAGLVSAARLSSFHDALTRRPHVAGTPGGRAVADEIAGSLRELGLAVEVPTYEAYLSHPRRVRVALVRPRAMELPTRERADPRDRDTSHPDLTPGFIAYSASGRVRGPVVYVNYGLPSDYDALATAGVDVRGVVALARYGKVHRAVKVHEAEARGARAIVIYSDPADDGYAQGDTWPKGPWRAPWLLQRGNAKYSWLWHGDPLTPLAAATPDAERLAPERAPTLPRVPAVPLSWSAAQEILSNLGGPVVPRGFQGGLPLTYHCGRGPAEVELDVDMDAGRKPIFDVLGRIEGSEEKDRWVMLGTHHDAWTFGGVDPGGSAAALLEVARVLGEMSRTGWRPRRTIVFAFWDAEEYGLVGSTEFAEERAAELREKAVVYLNSDLYTAGGLKAGGAASLRDFVVELARSVEDPSGEGSLYDAWRRASWARLGPVERRHRAGVFEVELDPLGSGADFVPFQTFLGLPSLSLELGSYVYGSYHSSYDTRQYMQTFGDPGWRHGRALAELLGRAALRLASADVLPLRLSHTAEVLGAYLDGLEAENVDASGQPRLASLGLGGTRERVAALARAARDVEERLPAALEARTLPQASRRELNDRLAQAERAFVDTDPGPPGAAPRFYRHTVYGWDIYALYGGDTLPGLRRALRDRDGEAFSSSRERLERALERAAAELARAAALLR